MSTPHLPLILFFLFFACSAEKGTKPVVQRGAGKSDIMPAAGITPVEESRMINFEEGTFMMGSSAGMAQPVHPVKVKAFRLDRSPVTVAEFRRFIEETGYITDAERFGDSGVFDFNSGTWKLVSGAKWQYPLGRNASAAADDHPVTQVSWNDAMAYAVWAGKRLPTEAEWEYAARCGGTGNSRFSWGNRLIVGGKYMANVWQGTATTDKQSEDGFLLTSPVGFYGETACGLTDMGGNVWNWCFDTFKPYPGSTVPDPGNPDLKIIRGGSFFFDQNGEDSFSVTGRAYNTSETSLFNTGFRCASDAL